MVALNCFSNYTTKVFVKQILVWYISCHNRCTGQILFEIEQLNNFKLNLFSWKLYFTIFLIVIEFFLNKLKRGTYLCKSG